MRGPTSGPRRGVRGFIGVCLTEQAGAGTVRSPLEEGGWPGHRGGRTTSASRSPRFWQRCCSRVWLPAAAPTARRRNTRGPAPGRPADAADAPARVTSAVGPGPHSGLPRATPAPAPVRYFACRDGQEAPNCTPVAATGAGAPAGATHGCATIGTYQSCIPVTEAGWERARGDPRNGWRTGPTFVCRV